MEGHRDAGEAGEAPFTEAGRSGPGASRLRRCLDAVALVTVLIAIGEVFEPSVETYILLTIPATLLFQIGLSRRPLRELWVRDGAALEWRTIKLAIALPFAIVPLITLFSGNFEADEILYSVGAVVGAFIASYAIRQGNRATWRYLGLAMATAGLIGVLASVLHELGAEEAARGGAGQPTGLSDADLILFLQQFLILFPVCFVMEEVTFRGAIDSHVHHPGERHGLLTAIFVSLLWGLWHFPLTPESDDFIVRVASVIPLQLFMGIFLSIYWRRSGNLTVTATPHAFSDSVRNALGFTP